MWSEYKPGYVPPALSAMPSLAAASVIYLPCHAGIQRPTPRQWASNP